MKMLCEILKKVKGAVKWFLIIIFYILVLPAGWSSKLAYKFLCSTKFFEFFVEFFALFPGLPGTLVRACYYKQTLEKSYLDLDIGFGSIISKMDARLGRGILITGHSTIGLVDIGDNTVIANYVSILSGRYQHNFQETDKSILDGHDVFTRTIIGENTFIGDKSTVMADVGSNSIVGAGSVVVKPVPDNVMVAGNPAKVIKERPPRGNQKVEEISLTGLFTLALMIINYSYLDELFNPDLSVFFALIN